MIEPALATEPIENAEAKEPTDATDRIEPAKPTDKIEPDEPIGKIDPLDPMLKMEAEDPGEREEPAEIRIPAFWQAEEQPGISGSVPRAHITSRDRAERQKRTFAPKRGDA